MYTYAWLIPLSLSPVYGGHGKGLFHGGNFAKEGQESVRQWLRANYTFIWLGRD